MQPMYKLFLKILKALTAPLVAKILFEILLWNCLLEYWILRGKIEKAGFLVFFYFFIPLRDKFSSG